MPYPNRMECISFTIRLRKEARECAQLNVRRVRRPTKRLILSQPIGKAVYSISD